ACRSRATWRSCWAARSRSRARLAKAACSLNCSKRHLYNAVADDEETLAAMIQRRRLEACLRDLRSSAQAQRSVTDIALSWGFSNSAHFSRVFRTHVGCSPSEYRVRARGPALPH
ncbi:helix-turn-helix domain-containing protein, partial [Acidovorax sp. NPDC077664]|uniref:helix-turn-helix domain-containing protein n=1 Tax=Acidovorax sp. NPDC077664 TaxID=3390544 RepID=UPI003D03A3C6